MLVFSLQLPFVTVQQARIGQIRQLQVGRRARRHRAAVGGHPDPDDAAQLVTLAAGSETRGGDAQLYVPVVHLRHALCHTDHAEQGAEPAYRIAPDGR
jgi:hypothetical protein